MAEALGINVGLVALGVFAVGGLLAGRHLNAHCPRDKAGERRHGDGASEAACPGVKTGDFSGGRMGARVTSLPSSEICAYSTSPDRLRSGGFCHYARL